MDIFENLGEAIKETLENVIEKNNTNIDTKRSNLSNDEVELAKKLDAIEEFTIDRFEGDFAVLEDRNTGKMLDVKKEDMLDVKKEDLPENVKEGDILDKINGKYTVNEEKTLEAKERIKDKMKKLWNN